MSGGLSAIEALERVPGWDPASADIEELKGGLTNRTYLVTDAGRRCILRLDSAQSTMFRFDRSAELAILEAASGRGIAPAVIYADPEASILATEYLEGRVWDESDLADDAGLEALACLLRKVHAIEVDGEPFDISAAAHTYESHLRARQGLHAFALTCVEIVASVPARPEAACCHNDVVAANVIDSGTLKLIDWEFACLHDPYFDLASAIGFHNLGDDRADVLLQAYTGGADGGDRERLADQVRVYDAVQWLWLATRQLVFPSRWQARRLEELQQRIR